MPLSDSDNGLERSPAVDSAPQRSSVRVGVATIMLCLALIGLYVFLLAPPPVAYFLLLIPMLFASLLFELRGSLLVLAVGLVLMVTAALINPSHPWDVDLGLNLLPVAGGLLVCALMAGWFSQYARQHATEPHAPPEKATQHRRVLQAILDQLPDGILLVDTANRLRLANSAAVHLLGMEGVPTLGEEVARSAPYASLTDLFVRATLSAGPVSGEVKLSGDSALSVTINPVPGLGRIAVLSNGAALNRSTAELGDLISDLSHDLKRPLAAIASYADLIKALGPLNKQQLELVHRVRHKTEAMRCLIDKLLDITWIETGMGLRRRPTDVGEIVRTVVHEQTALAKERRQTLEAQVDKELPYIDGDAVRLQQVADNLLSNAIKYTPEGGRIDVTLTQQDQHIVLCVKDTGIGISPEDREKIFERFFRAEAAAEGEEGNGLGLAIVRAIVGQHDGDVRVESEPGKGSTFTVRLPARRG